MSEACQASAIPVVNESRDGASTSSSSSTSSWKSHGKAFRPYSYPSQSSPRNSLEASSTLPVIVKKPLVTRLTKYIVETYQICNSEFRYSESLNPKRFLTNPSNGVLNDGYDNANSDLILHVNFELVNIERKQRYIVKDLLGHGTFGQVAKCWDPETDSFLAVKIIKNQPAYYRQAVVEVSLLHMLNQKFDPDDKHHIVRMIDYFVFQRHLCISFEMLGSNLYELIKMNHFKGLSLSIVQMFSKQILHALVVMKDAGIIHCDLKPENILISTSVKPTEIKVIDFGSACMEGRTVYSYIQSRYYRSPEVLLGYPYTTSIDMWSFGCIVAELFLGLPLFPGASEYDLLKRMIDILGEQPPDYLLRDSKDTCKFFKHVGSIYHLEHDQVSKEFPSSYRVLTEEEYEARDSRKPVIGRRYFNYVTLEDIIFNYPYRKNLPDEEISKERLTRFALVDFLRGLVEFDPGKRWSPLQASGHPFVTGKPFTCPYKPLVESPRIPVIQTVTVDHNPGGGHWLAAGLSPQVSSFNKHLLHNSPHFHKAPLSYGSSYGIGSHGSYNDNTGLASSYGSYNDANSVHGYTSPACPSGFNMLVQVGGPFLGSSPDARYRSQPSRGKGFGVIPFGGLGPMSLGASPSQFTPPSSQMHISSASPVKYGPTYPVRAAVHGSSLGKAAVTAQYNKRSWGQPTTCIQPYGHASENGPGFCTDSMGCSYLETQYDRHVRAPFSAISASSLSNPRQQRVGVYDMSSGLTSGNQKNCLAPCVVNSILVSSNNSEISGDKQEASSSLLDPADWDPNYSDESLLQEDNAEISSLNSEFANFLAFGDPVDAANVRSGMGRYANGHHQAHSSSNKRTDSFRQAYSFAGTSSSTSLDTYVGNGHPPQVYQNFPSRFRQQPVQWHSSNMHGDKSRQYCQPSHLNYNVDESPSFNNSMFRNSLTWGMGRGIGHSMTTQTRKDCGKI